MGLPPARAAPAMGQPQLGAVPGGDSSGRGARAALPGGPGPRLCSAEGCKKLIYFWKSSSQSLSNSTRTSSVHSILNPFLLCFKFIKHDRCSLVRAAPSRGAAAEQHLLQDALARPKKPSGNEFLFLLVVLSSAGWVTVTHGVWGQLWGHSRAGHRLCCCSSWGLEGSQRHLAGCGVQRDSEELALLQERAQGGWHSVHTVLLALRASLAVRGG